MKDNWDTFLESIDGTKAIVDKRRLAKLTEQLQTLVWKLERLQND